MMTNNREIDRWLQVGIFALLGLVLLAAPWFFGAWEMWWFWPFATVIFLVTIAFGGRLIFCLVLGTSHMRMHKIVFYTAIAYLPFLVYAALRFLQSPVYMDAERSFLLFLTPLLVALPIAIGFPISHLRLLAWMLAVNFLLLGGYGIANHFIDHNAHVLWRPGFPHYQATHFRATGSYFCPDHFAGIMEMAFCLGLAFILARETTRGLRGMGWALIVLGVVGVVLSKSRGGAIVLGALLVTGLLVGMVQYRPLWRWILRGAFLLLLASGALFFFISSSDYAQRFRAPWAEVRAMDRVIMIQGALRAWDTSKVWGIAPGMHRNLWPHFAASPDGNRETRKWPSQLNNHFHSYEVHSDWIQLMEEYGLVGLALFLIALAVYINALLTVWRREAKDRRLGDWQDTERPEFWAPLNGLFVCVAMGVHSLGDFNLQIPATTWLFAAMLAMALAFVRRDSHMRVKE